MPTRIRKPGRRKVKRTAVWGLVVAAALIALELAAPSSAARDLLVRPVLAFYRAGPARFLAHPCPSRPSCSAYAEEAIGRHGLIWGTFMAADRLIHEQGRLKEGPWVVVGDRIMIDDPVPERVRWWAGGEGER